jgi:predicted DNA-binding protein (UPF0251 family)
LQNIRQQLWARLKSLGLTTSEVECIILYIRHPCHEDIAAYLRVHRTHVTRLLINARRKLAKKRKYVNFRDISRYA